MHVLGTLKFRKTGDVAFELRPKDSASCCGGAGLCVREGPEFDFKFPVDRQFKLIWPYPRFELLLSVSKFFINLSAWS